MRHTQALAGAAVGLLLLSACSGGGEDVDLDGEGGGGGADAAESGPVLRAAIGGEPDQLDPHKTSSYFSFQVLENVYDTLVEPDENLEMQPALAESWETSEDGLTWTFQLREGVKFHDNSDFTADDVVFTFNRIIDEDLNQSYRFGTVESGDVALGPVGTGPFSLTGYTAGQSIELRANPDHWGGAPEIGGVTYSFISEGATALAALKGGEVDWTDSVPVQQLEQLQGDDAVETDVVPSTDYWYLTMNQAKAPWNDVRARQAVAYAIDREAIIEAVSFGTATPNQLAIPEQSSWYTEYDGYSTDVDRAKSLLAEAGVTSATVDYLASSDDPETVTAGQIIASNLAPLGITVNIRTVDFPTWLAEQEAGTFDMYMLGWLANIDPDEFYYSQHHSEGNFNAQGYSNPEVDRLLDEARVETDTAARKALYDEAATIIADEASYIYLYNPSVIQAWSPDLEGYTVRSDRAIRFRDVSMAE